MTKSIRTTPEDYHWMAQAKPNEIREVLVEAKTFRKRRRIRYKSI